MFLSKGDLVIVRKPRGPNNVMNVYWVGLMEKLDNKIAIITAEVTTDVYLLKFPLVGQGFYLPGAWLEKYDCTMAKDFLELLLKMEA